MTFRQAVDRWVHNEISYADLKMAYQKERSMADAIIEKELMLQSWLSFWEPIMKHFTHADTILDMFLRRK